MVKTDEASSIVSRHFIPQIIEPKGVEKIRMPRLALDKAATAQEYEKRSELFSDILPVKKVGMKHYWFTPWDNLIRFWRVEQAMMDLVLRPEIITFSSMSHGGLIQGIWAYECRSYFISSTCFEDCGILDPFGHPVALATDYARAPMAKINLDYVMVHLTHLLPKIADVRRKYREEVTVEVPAHVGAGLIFSNGPTRTAADIARELDLMPLDDYLTRCQEQCRKTREDDDVLKEAKP